MSLLLRKAGQKVLDQYKLPNFHVGINDHNQMNIQSECGKPFVTIVGIRFNRTTPTAEEIVYATELLDGYMATHIQTMKTYLKAEQSFAKKKAPAFDKQFELNINLNYYNSKTHKHLLRANLLYKDDILKITYRTEDNKTTITTNLTSERVTTAKVEAFKINKTLRKTALKYLKDHTTYQREKHSLEQLKIKLSACNI